MNEKQLQELLTHVAKTYGITAMISLWVAFDNSCTSTTVEYGTRAVDYYNQTCESLAKLNK